MSKLDGQKFYRAELQITGILKSKKKESRHWIRLSDIPEQVGISPELFNELERMALSKLDLFKEYSIGAKISLFEGTSDGEFEAVSLHPIKYQLIMLPKKGEV